MTSARAIPRSIVDDDTLPILHPRSRSAFRRAGVPIVDAAGVTDRGRRRERNEDQFAIVELDRWLRVWQSSFPLAAEASWVGGSQSMLLAVADGLGGHGRGDVASAVALDALLYYAISAMPWLAVTVDDQTRRETVNNLSGAVRLCQARLESVARRKQLIAQAPGTTLTAAYIVWPSLYVAHAGDSRCYLLRGGSLSQLTTDHTLAARLAAGSGAATRMSHVLVNAVVADGQSDVAPEVRRFDLVGGDTLLLCTDGLTKHVPDDAMCKIVTHAATAASACAQLVEAANAAGGTDNVTVVVARM